ncbi:glycoside hydrolase family 5 protein [Candidatus Gottesmanbacteria bacterium]|nr:glycoside hydrolase family 5 protein [Candidatus Gottesmanbacteria bacterium]
MNFLRKPIFLVITILIILVILGLASFFFINQYQASKPLPALYVDGPYIRRTDTGEAVLLKGPSSISFSIEREKPFSKISEVLKLQFLDWKINLLRITFDAVAIMDQSQYQDLDSLVAYAEKRGIYLILDPVQINSTTIDLPDERIITAMQFLAERYSTKTNLMYGLWGSLGGVKWDEWLPWARKIAAAIREKNPTAIILLSGTQWGRDFRDFKDKMGEFPFQNFVLAVRDQQWPDLDIRPWWNQFIGKLPIIVVEFGAGVDKNCEKGSRCDFGYIIETLRIVNKDDQGTKSETPFLHYTFHPMEDLEKNGVLTDWGEIISSDLRNYPPTEFKKRWFFF